MSFDFTIFITAIRDVINYLDKHNEKTIEALGAIRKAFIYTYDYLINNKGNYEPNKELALLWNEASTKVMKVNPQLGDTLASKSRFWIHPNIYIELNRTSEIPTLHEIIDEMERLKNEIS